MYSTTNPEALEPIRSRRWAAFTELWIPALKSHAPLFILLAIHIAGAAALTAVTPGMTPPGLNIIGLSFLTFLGVLVPLSILSLRFYHLVTIVKPEHPIPALLRDVWDFVRQPDRAANGLSIVLVYVFFMDVFAYLKGSVPIVQPFAWDNTFIEWDRWLHFGTAPWEWLQPVLGYAPVTLFLVACYHLWFMIMWILVTSFAFARVPSILRMRFFLAFMLTWGVGGNLMAIIFSSAGPCFYALTGNSPDPFAPLLDYLHTLNETVPVWSIDTQMLLWDGYQGRGLRLGISAMPSMHNAAALLFALACWHINRKLGIALFIFTGFILLGSVHLAWHYAIDGYVGIAIALVAWWVSGIIARKWDASTWAQDYAQTLKRVGAANADI
jgi:hypothetical protein